MLRHVSCPSKLLCHVRKYPTRVLREFANSSAHMMFVNRDACIAAFKVSIISGGSHLVIPDAGSPLSGRRIPLDSLELAAPVRIDDPHVVLNLLAVCKRKDRLSRDRNLELAAEILI
jgi:hypothetical protein